MEPIYPILLFATTLGILMLGFPVAFSLAGCALFFALIGSATGHFFLSDLGAFPSRIYGIMTNETLLAIPLFVFMGIILEQSKIAERLLETLSLQFGSRPGGIGISVFLVGALLAASTGIVGATVVTMGLIALPTMLKNNYSPQLAAGTIVAAGTLGQIIPPSIILIILGDQIGSAYQQALIMRGDYSGGAVSVGDLFAGALLPGFLLVGMFILYLIIISHWKKELAPPIQDRQSLPLSADGSPQGHRGHRGKITLLETLKILLPPLFLILSVLGSILLGIATPTEAASFGGVGSLALAYQKLNIEKLRVIVKKTLLINSMVFMILIGASFFSLVFRGFGGDEYVTQILSSLPGGVWTSFILVMLLIFVLGFFLDFLEITFVVVPIVGPILLNLGLDPIWLGVMIAMNLQTSFLTPPFGFALFYLRGVAPASLSTEAIYKGAIPFIIIQLLCMILLIAFPKIITWLPKVIYG